MIARNGYQIFDADTHVGPDAAILSGYLSAAKKNRLAEWTEYEVRDRHGRVTYTKGQRRYRRRLGDAEPNASLRRASLARPHRHSAPHRRTRASTARWPKVRQRSSAR